MRMFGPTPCDNGRTPCMPINLGLFLFQTVGKRMWPQNNDLSVLITIAKLMD